MKFRKKPIVIEAWQWLGQNAQSWPDWLKEYWHPKTHEVVYQMDSKVLFIPTLEGRMAAQHGDWILRGIAGEVYPCRDDIFRATYEEVPDGDGDAD